MGWEVERGRYMSKKHDEGVERKEGRRRKKADEGVIERKERWMKERKEMDENQSSSSLTPGPVAVILLVCLVQALVYREVISIGVVPSREKKLPWFRSVHW
jgi:hypothetical protein